MVNSQMQGGLLIGGILMVTIGGVMLAIGIYLSGTLFGSLDTNSSTFYAPYNASNPTAGPFNGSPTVAGQSFVDAQNNTFTAYKILGIALVVSGFSVIIGTLLSMVNFG